MGRQRRRRERRPALTAFPRPGTTLCGREFPQSLFLSGGSRGPYRATLQTRTTMMIRLAAALCAALLATSALADPAYLLKPARVFDGVDSKPHEGWSVLVRGDKIEAVGPSVPTPADATVVDLAGKTVMPGMIEGHSHLFLHPYNETSWDDQVLKEPLALRTARAVNHARATLMAGFTTTRDLGTEGAGYSDVGLKQAIEQGIVPGTRMLVPTR